MRRRLLQVLLGFALASPATAQEPIPLIESAKVIQQGIELHDQGKYKEAIQQYRQIPRSDSNYVWALYEMSMSLSADSQYSEALRVCREGILSDAERERLPDLYNQYANLVDDLGDPQRALLIYDTALSRYPAYSSLYINKGATLLRLERYADAEKVFKQGLLIDPYAASCHYLLGLAAINQGKIVPAFINFISYLMISPEGRYSGKSINLLSTIAKNKDELAPLIKNRKDGPGESYGLVEQIILSKIALDKQYKPIIHLDDPISRQIQVLFEKLEYNEDDPDFWMQYYVPVYKKIFEEKEFETFVNYIFSGVNIEEIQNYNKKNKKERDALIQEIVAYLNDIRSTRVLDLAQRKKTEIRYAYEEGKLSGKGKLSSDGNQLLGPWEFYYSAGNLRARGQFNDQGERVGDWNYYTFSGLTRGKEQYKGGKLEGHIQYFFVENGNPASDQHYKDGELTGEKVNWYLSGALRMKEQYDNGMLQGEKTTYFSNGHLQTRQHYQRDSLDGLYQSYFQNGQLESQGNYVHGDLQGKVSTYHSNGQLESEGNYLNGNKDGEWKSYFDNGQLEKIQHFVAGELDGPYEEYYRNGALFTKYSYKKGKLDGEITYNDDDGKMFSVLLFDKGQVKQARYYDKKGQLISSSTLQNKKLELTAFRPDGTRKSITNYDEKGLAEGQETYYFHSGALSEINNYQQGNLDGTSKGYFANGKPSVEINYSNGKKDGYYRSWYIHGSLQREGWYVADQAQGQWNSYDELGNLAARTNYYNDDLHGFKEEFWPNGKKESETEYQYGWIKKFTQFDTSGRVIQTLDLHTGTGPFTLLHLNGKKSVEGKYERGNFNGPYTLYFFDGSVETQIHYQDGMFDSVYRDYYYGGKIHIEGQYHLGDKTGTWKYYTEKGRLFLTEEYKNGQMNGKRIFYYDNGGRDLETDMENGNREGLNRKYDPSGKLLYQIRFDDDLPIAYTYEGADGKLKPEIPLHAASGQIKSYYSNGQPSASFEYKDGKIVGPDILYYPNGKVMRQTVEDYSQTEGKSAEYFPDGKLKEEDNYVHDNLHGPYRILNEQGQVMEEGNYFNGNKHGDIRYFDEKGKKLAVYHYYFGKLLSVDK